MTCDDEDIVEAACEAMALADVDWEEEDDVDNDKKILHGSGIIPVYG